MIERRSHIGHWEGDTVIGAAQQHAFVMLVERKSGYTILRRVNLKTAEEVSTAIVNRLKLLASQFKTISYDNGKEFTEHKFIDASLVSMAYIADPFAIWQLRSNENYSGLLRQYIPKKRR